MKWYASALVLLMLSGLVWLVDTAFVRNHFVGNEVKCSAQQFAALPNEVPFVVFGSSRVRAGFSSELAEKIAGESFAPVYNLGRSGINIARNYRMFKDLLQSGVRPKFAYVEVDLLALEARVGSADVRAVDDAGVLTFSDIFVSTRILSETSVAARIHIAALSFLHKIRSGMVLLLTGEVGRNYLSVPEVAPRVCWRVEYDRRTPLKLKAIEQQRALYAKRYGDLETTFRKEIGIGSGWRARHELYFLDRIRELAHANGVTLVVSRHWTAYEPPLSAKSIATLQARIPEFRFPPEAMVRESWKHFGDKTHMFTAAREIFTRWLVSLAKNNNKFHASRN